MDTQDTADTRVDGSPASGPSETPPPWKEGDVGDPPRIGRYPVLKRVGEGGMGVVYAAYDEELDRRIAIKLLLGREGASDDRARTRIRREAQAMARLSDPAVVHVYEVGEWNGQTYVAMEYVRGQTLREWLATPRTLDERIDVLLQAARGLVAAHRAGVVHRDFKPDNVMVGREGRVRVLDFGLARAHDEERIGTTSTQELMGSFLALGGDALQAELTQAGTIMGTPAYMAPEQHLGANTSPSTDQFSFCAVMYEALYGVRPFVGQRIADIGMAIFEGRINPPPEGHGVPPALYHVLERGFATNPGARWPTMEALVAAIEEVTGARRRRGGLVLVGVLVLLVVGLVATLLLRPNASQTEPDRVEALVQSANAAAARARWVYPEAENARDTALVWTHELAAMDEETAEQRAAQLAREFGAAMVRLGDYYWQREGGRIFARDFYLQAVLFDGSLAEARARSGFTNAEIADLRARALAGELTELEVSAGNDLASLAAAVPDDPAQVDEAKVSAELAAVTERSRAKRPPSHVAQVTTPALPEPEPGEPEPEPEPVEAEPDAEPVEAELIETEPTDGTVDDAARRKAARDKADALVDEGNGLRRRGRASEAEQKYLAALKLEPRSARAHDGLRQLRYDAGRYDEAVGHAEKAVRHGPRNALYQRYLGDAYFKVGRLADARDAYERAASLGDGKAAERLARVEAKLGG